MNKLKQKSRTAGFAYLLVIVFGVSAQLIRGSIITPEDAQALTESIGSSLFLFRLSFVLDLFMMTSFFMLPLAFYPLLKKVNKKVAKLMVLLVMVSIPINCLNLLSQFATVLLISDGEYLRLFGSQDLQAQVKLFIDLYQNGYHIAQIFFGLWLFPLGYLVYKSEFLPKLFGILLMLGCFGHLIELLVLFLAPNLVVVTYPGMAIATVAEIGFPLWLLIQGVRKQYNPS